MPLFPNQRDSKIAELRAQFKITTVRTGEFLSVEASSFAIRSIHGKKPVPIVRFEYERLPRNKPVSHIHFHSDYVPLATSLQRTYKKVAAYQQSKIHYPMGGHRYRVCIEDVIQFAIEEFGFHSKPGWYEVVEHGRLAFRIKQASAVIRKNHKLAAQILGDDLGYDVGLTPTSVGEAPGPRTDW